MRICSSSPRLSRCSRKCRLSRLPSLPTAFPMPSANGNGTESITSAGLRLDATTMHYPASDGGGSDVLNGVTIGLKTIDSPTKSTLMIGRLGSKTLSSCSIKEQIWHLGMLETTNYPFVIGPF